MRTVQEIQELCKKHKPACEIALRRRGFKGAEPLRLKGICGAITDVLGYYLSRQYVVIERAVMNEELTDDNKDITIWGDSFPGFFSGHVFLVMSNIIVDGGFHQYMNAFNLAHEEPNDVLVVSYSRLDEKVEAMVSKSNGILPEGVKNLEHLKQGLRSIWDYKMPPSYVREFKQVKEDE